MQIYPTKELALHGQKPRKRNRTSLTIALAVALVALVGGGWWFGVGLPANQAAEARAAEQTKTEAAAKKKAEDSAAFWAQVAKDNTVKSEKAAADAAAFNASQASRQSDSVKRQMETQGWTQFAGDFYYQYADKSEYTCGYSNCSYVHVTTMAPNGCEGGLYVAATIDKGGSSVGMTNSITAALPQGKDAIVKLEDHTGAGDKIGLTDLHCLRG
jgi:hypothetical protein